MKAPYWQRKRYAPSMEFGRWHWFRIGPNAHAVEPDSLPTNVFRLLTAGTDHTYYRTYSTNAEALADFQQAFDRAKQETATGSS